MVYVALFCTGRGSLEVCLHHLLPGRPTQDQSQENLWGVSKQKINWCFQMSFIFKFSNHCNMKITIHGLFLEITKNRLKWHRFFPQFHNIQELTWIWSLWFIKLLCNSFLIFKSLQYSDIEKKLHWATAQLQPSHTFSKWSIIMEQPYTSTHIAIHNVCACVGLLRNDTPLWKCMAGLKLGHRLLGTDRLLELSP